MMKKRLAVLLCGAMLLGTGSVAFAEENTDAQATEAEASDCLLYTSDDSKSKSQPDNKTSVTCYCPDIVGLSLIHI